MSGRTLARCAALAGALAGAAFAACSSTPSDAPVTAPSTDGGNEVNEAAVEAKTPLPVEEAGADADTVTGPAKLSETGLYSNFAARTLAAGVVPFAPRISFWSDGAEKARWIQLPAGAKVDTSNMDGWVFPIGTKVWKEFRVDGKLVETRLLMKVRDTVLQSGDGWWMAPYVWNDDESDAIAVLTGKPDVRQTTHDIPHQNDCINCHQNVRDVLLGFSAIQLSREPDETDASADAANDAMADAGAGPSPLMQFAAEGWFSNPPSADFVIPGTGDVKRALGYMHANCGGCHNAEAVRLATQTAMRLRLLVGQKTPAETGAYTTTVGVKMKHVIDGVTDIVVPGSPANSGLWLRVGRRDYYGMPPVASEVVDTDGHDLLGRWITGL